MSDTIISTIIVLLFAYCYKSIYLCILLKNNLQLTFSEFKIVYTPLMLPDLSKTKIIVLPTVRIRLSCISSNGISELSFTPPERKKMQLISHNSVFNLLHSLLYLFMIGEWSLNSDLIVQIIRHIFLRLGNILITVFF